MLKRRYEAMADSRSSRSVDSIFAGVGSRIRRFTSDLRLFLSMPVRSDFTTRPATFGQFDGYHGTTERHGRRILTFPLKLDFL